MILIILIIFIILIFFVIVNNNFNIEKSKDSKLIPIKLKEKSFMFIEPLIISTSDPSVLLNKRHSFVHAHRLNMDVIHNNSKIQQKFSQEAIESGSI